MTDIRDMIAGEVATRWLTEEALLTPVMQASFVRYAAEREPVRWQRWAARCGKAPDDPQLAADAALVVLAMVSEAMRYEIDKCAAVIETRATLGEL
jgi:hypothetical protein